MMNISIVLALSSRIQLAKMLSMELMMTIPMIIQAIPVIAQATHLMEAVMVSVKTLIH